MDDHWSRFLSSFLFLPSDQNSSWFCCSLIVFRFRSVNKAANVLFSKNFQVVLCFSAMIRRPHVFLVLFLPTSWLRVPEYYKQIPTVCGEGFKINKPRTTFHVKTKYTCLLSDSTNEMLYFLKKPILSVKQLMLQMLHYLFMVDIWPTSTTHTRPRFFISITISSQS